MNPHGCQVVAVLIGLAFCATVTAEERDWDSDLARGYGENAKKPLLDFLDDWHRNSKPVSDDLLKRKPAFEKAVYNLYGAFFKPAERHYKDTEYIVIQNEINVYILDSDLRHVFDANTANTWDRESLLCRLPQISHLVVKGFRPSIKLDGKKVLHLQNDRLAPMLGFLTEDNGYRMINGYGDEDCEAEKRKRRLRYLNSAMKIFPGHWGTGWHFQTHPHIDALYFSSNLKKAVVLYRVYYGGGEALMNREEDGDWNIVSMMDTWVE